MHLAQLGWNSTFEKEFAAHAAIGLAPARVSRDHGSFYAVIGDGGEMQAHLAGRFRHAASSRAELPVVGDWVAIDARPAEQSATIHAVLPRRGRFSRKVAGASTEEQVVAANIDTVFLVMGLDHDYNLRRLERYLAAAYDSGATPVIVLNKADLCGDLPARRSEIDSISIGVTTHVISAIDPGSLTTLSPHLRPGQTIALLGSSGVGKSTLTNALLGDARQKTQAVRADDSHGRHTTTCRELMVLPCGALLIDTPGLRELAVWDQRDGVAHSFGDVEAFAARCRFRDCRHQGEPGCAVQAALADGQLDPGRFENYLKIQRELAHLHRQQDRLAAQKEKNRWKAIAKLQRQYSRHKGKS